MPMLKTRTLLLIGMLCFAFGIPVMAAPRGGGGQVEITLNFDRLPQGSLGTITVTGEEIEQIQVALLDNQFLLQPLDPETYWGMVAVPIDAERGVHRLSLLMTFADGQQRYAWDEVQVTRGIFPSLDIALPYSFSDLLDEDIYLDELAFLEQATRERTAGNLWMVSGLEFPFQRRIVDGFGTFRRFNQQIWQRHQGLDFPQPLGTPIEVMATGRVVMIAQLPIRGNYVLVDHGGGLYSGYAHLSEIMVELDEMVLMGDILGEVGSTGRSLGPHLHWEVFLGGVFVNPTDVADLLQEINEMEVAEQ